MNKDISNYLTAIQAANYLTDQLQHPIRVRQIQQQCAAGKIRALKFGRDWLIDKDELQKYINVKSGRPKLIK